MSVSVKSPRMMAKPGARSVVPSDSLPIQKALEATGARRGGVRVKQPPRAKWMDKYNDTLS